MVTWSMAGGMINNRTALAPRHEVALDCIEAGINAADPTAVIDSKLALEGTTLTIGADRYDLDAYERLLVVGGGNAAGIAASALESLLGNRIDDGVVVTDKAVACDQIRVKAGDHPIPSERGVENTRSVLRLAEEATASDLVVAIVTGGGSALLGAPAGEITLDALQSTTSALLESGAPIEAINAVRKHCSAIKGGQLARACTPATTVGLVFSDVVDDRLDVIASGVCTPDESTYSDALEVLDRFDVSVPSSVIVHLESGVDGALPETPASDDPAFEQVTQHVVADSTTALEAATTTAREAGYTPLVLSGHVRGEAREAAKTIVAIAKQCLYTGQPVEPPAILLSGGETTVTVTGNGEGGPNQEFALSAAIETDAPEITVASVDTDGIDGVEAAGAITTTETAMPQNAAQSALDANDAGTFLDQADARIYTGQTNTNVNDLRVVVIEEPSDRE